MIDPDINLEQLPVPSLIVDARVSNALDSRNRSSLSREKVAELVRSGTIRAANASALQLFAADDIAELQGGRCFRGRYLDWFLDRIAQPADFGDWSETTIHTVQGREVPVLVCARTACGRHGEPMLVASFLDITTLKDAQAEAQAARQAAEEANASKSAFLAIASHEIRTPLNGVLGMAQLLQRRPLGIEEQGMVGVILESGEGLLTILNDLLDLAKIDAGRIELEVAPFSLRGLLRSVQDTFRAVAERKGVALRVDAEGPDGWSGDVARIKQILFNLVSNALKFTEAGAVEVLAWREEGDLCVSVKDSGIGVAQDAIPRLFERFTQAESSIARRFGGTGLGLAVCQDLAELMGGQIHAVSALGLGSTFELRAPLPLARTSSDDVDGADTTAPARRISSRPLRILAAEDNSVNQLVLRTMLAPLGAELTMVSDGLAALQAVFASPFDIVLMDVEMPLMGGVESVREIRRREAQAGQAPVPVLALTANAMVHQVTAYLDAGMDGHVEKPIKIDALIAAIQAHAHPSPEDADPTVRKIALHP